MTSYSIEADGGSRGNPGPAGYGAVVYAPDGTVVAEAAESIGVTTNNVAEYRGLIAGLTALSGLGLDGVPVEVRMDSKLVIEQMAGRWKIKNEGLRPLATEAAALARRFRVTWTWIPRERNTHADALANEAMDAAARGEKWTSTSTHTTTRLFDPDPDPARKDEGQAADAPPEPAEKAGGPPAETDLLDDLGSVSTTTRSSTTVSPGNPWTGATRVATTLILLRHGQTPLSVERRFSGLGDPALTELGEAQAEKAAARLAGAKLDAIVSSPLARARQTAEAVAKATGLPVHVDDDLRETDFGAWEGRTFAEIRDRWPHEMNAWLADPAVAPPGGESFQAAGHRVQRARDRILAGHPGETVLVVSHVTPIKLLVRYALNAPPEALYRMHLDLACLSAIDYYSDGPSVLRVFNDTAHLTFPR
ncbi:bifunctional RNase H/acid phosphatase [Herbidospora sp. NBRC 101105]|uniref:bifunctional RNase H/acid phosphatase n=1 Tax=Herbidospora sp. NBRC 101105 TaxID=3032195 RepID=UPI0024A3B775|nr:bifunctional RNase H/acid phosphatase [Herbidospora sp. NBRC 101105]GLX94424.1 bifunctional RNase H/acid phosphatase [Herbidospora sp. NBRC 101105]